MISFDADRGCQKQTIQDFFSPLETLAAQLLALSVLVSDDYLVCRLRGDENFRGRLAIRFLKCACQLPLELQMVLTNRAQGLIGDIVLIREASPALKFELALSSER